MSPENLGFGMWYILEGEFLEGEDATGKKQTITGPTTVRLREVDAAGHDVLLVQHGSGTLSINGITEESFPTIVKPVEQNR